MSIFQDFQSAQKIPTVPVLYADTTPENVQEFNIFGINVYFQQHREIFPLCKKEKKKRSPIYTESVLDCIKGYLIISLTLVRVVRAQTRVGQ